MMLQKLLLVIFTFYFSSLILEAPYFMVPDHSHDKVICSPITDGYEFKNIVAPKVGITMDSPKVDCWLICYMGKCNISLEHPMIDGWLARILIATMAGITAFIILEY